jgi:hypothetical protein
MKVCRICGRFHPPFYPHDIHGRHPWLARLLNWMSGKRFGA